MPDTEKSEWIGPSRFRHVGIIHYNGDKEKDNELVNTETMWKCHKGKTYCFFFGKYDCVCSYKNIFEEILFETKPEK